MQNRDQSVSVNGEVLKADRSAKFPSAEAFAAVCGASRQTVYRAERGERVRYSYLTGMANALGQPVSRYILDASQAHPLVDIQGKWTGYLIAADQRLNPYIVEEKITFTTHGNKVTGFGGADTPQGHRVKRFDHCHIEANVFLGTVKIEDWEEPSGTGSFTLNITNNQRRMEGFASWYDPDSDRIETSRYIMVRHQGYDYKEYQTWARELMAKELEYYRFRKEYEVDYSVSNAMQKRLR